MKIILIYVILQNLCQKCIFFIFLKTVIQHCTHIFLISYCLASLYIFCLPLLSIVTVICFYPLLLVNYRCLGIFSLVKPLYTTLIIESFIRSSIKSYLTLIILTTLFTYFFLTNYVYACAFPS